jgi:hypothetical protein
VRGRQHELDPHVASVRRRLAGDRDQLWCEGRRAAGKEPEHEADERAEHEQHGGHDRARAHGRCTEERSSGT